MREEDQVVAIVCGDIHLSHNPPLARAGEPNWYEAMARPLDELSLLAQRHDVPILCAGDVFDYWKAPPELINFALDRLPNMLAIPGQHDLPFHDLAGIEKSAYWTLVKAKKITPIPKEGLQFVNWPHSHGLKAYGYPWGEAVGYPDSVGEREKVTLRVAVIHAYTWVESAGYVGAPEEAKVKGVRYPGFHTAVIGDNHKPFDVKNAGCHVFNCGGFMRRKSDDVHVPRVGLLRRDGRVTQHKLDVGRDEFTQIKSGPDVERIAGDLDGFLRELGSLQSAVLDYPDAVRKMMDREGVPPEVRQCVERALEHGRGK